ncbi:uncharacterized protein [Blastocystis hominis]|uniref:Uncharacterized protein n=1 Tax=Blastocystis hominis TaxID=12968 RepID=D8M2R7_BLAHO|nr:uncharacterized protein [Blastocystis hominis]CBK22640.2 unnamed protein product [Blastocystis hominis]|eukprot:XP_012896688.1 uncharacterized protein [Blastocystis hominis]
MFLSFFPSSHPQSLCSTTPSLSFTSSSPSLRSLLLTAPFSPTTFSNFLFPPLAPISPVSPISTPFSSSEVSRELDTISSTFGSSFPPSSNGRFSAKTAGKPCFPAPPTRSTATASSASAASTRGSPSSSCTDRSGRRFPSKAPRRSFSTPSPSRPSTRTPRSSPSGVPRFPHRFHRSHRPNRSHRPHPRRSFTPFPAPSRSSRAASASLPAYRRTERRRSARCRRTARRCGRRRSRRRGARTWTRCSTRWASARWICRGIFSRSSTSPSSPSPTSEAGSRPCSTTGTSRPRGSPSPTGIPRGRSGTCPRSPGSPIPRRPPRSRSDAPNRGIWGNSGGSRGRTESSTPSSPRPSRRTAVNRCPRRRNARSYRCSDVRSNSTQILPPRRRKKELFLAETLLPAGSPLPAVLEQPGERFVQQGEFGGISGNAESGIVESAFLLRHRPHFPRLGRPFPGAGPAGRVVSVGDEPRCDRGNRGNRGSVGRDAAGAGDERSGEDDEFGGGEDERRAAAELPRDAREHREPAEGGESVQQGGGELPNADRRPAREDGGGEGAVLDLAVLHQCERAEGCEREEAT